MLTFIFRQIGVFITYCRSRVISRRSPNATWALSMSTITTRSSIQKGFSQGGIEVALVVDEDLNWQLDTSSSCTFGNQSTSATIHIDRLLKCTSPPYSREFILSLDELTPHNLSFSSRMYQHLYWQGRILHPSWISDVYHTKRLCLTCGTRFAFIDW